MTHSSKQIAAKLPYLRRYARALTGSQALGDQYVRICLEMIVQDPAMLPVDAELQRELFRLFHIVWRRTNPETVVAAPAAADAAEPVLALPPVERQVLLLISLERFGFNDVAYILSSSETAVRERFNRAQDDILRQARVPVLIIEDEKIIALDLASIVEDMGHTVCGVADREKNALALARSAVPHLILADIRLRGGDSGIATVRRILEEIDVPVIVITAHPEDLLTGESIEPAFVIAKPFSPEMVKAAISQALFVRGSGEQAAT